VDRGTPKNGGGLRWAAVLASAAVGVLFAVTGGAFADGISNNLDSSVDAVAETMPLTAGGASGTTRLYIDPQGNDGKQGCNLTGSTTATISLSSSDTGVATVSPSSVTFTSCVTSSTGPVVTVTPVAAGSATISATLTSNTTAGTFDVAPVTFLVNVTAPTPANTPPQVSLGGVTGGATYDKGSVPAATCNVTDAEDGNSTFAATLSAISGPYAADGIGSQTASCSYTDAGGLSASASVTYSIVDPLAPTIGYTLNPAAPDASNGWYASDVTLTWSVNEPESPNSLQKTGCDDQSIVADQAATTYSCSATSAGGSSGPVSVTIKRDATKPTITGSATPAANANGWRNQDVTVHFTCGDNLSGVASCTPDSTLGEGYGQSVDGDVSDDAGNTNATTVAGINVDEHDPNAPIISADRAPDYTAGNGDEWYKGTATLSFSGNGDPDLSDGHAGSGVDASTVPGSVSGSTTGALAAAGSVKDLAGNESAQASKTVYVDATNPTASFGNCPSAPFLLNASASASWSASDIGSGLASAATGWVTLDTTSVGSHTVYSGVPSDNVGNTGVAASCTYSVHYGFSGYLQPINDTAHQIGAVESRFKLGSTVPVKFRLTDVDGVAVQAVSPPTFSQKRIGSACDNMTDVETSVPTDAITSGTTYRWDSSLQGYIYNFSTKSLTSGEYRIYASLNDGTVQTVDICLAK
jgi:hypothetical protein